MTIAVQDDNDDVGGIEDENDVVYGSSSAKVMLQDQTITG